MLTLILTYFAYIVRKLVPNNYFTLHFCCLIAPFVGKFKVNFSIRTRYSAFFLNYLNINITTCCSQTVETLGVHKP